MHTIHQSVIDSTIARLMAGEHVVVDCRIYDAVIDHCFAQPDDSELYRAMKDLVSIPNPKCVGTRDTHIAFIKKGPSST